MEPSTSRKYLHFSSRCNLKFILESNFAYFEDTKKYIQEQSPKDLLRCQLHLWVKRFTVAWLIQNSGSISCKEENTSKSNTHACRLFTLEYEDKLSIIAGIVITHLHGPSPQVPNSSDHEFQPFMPDHCKSLTLTVQCTPTLQIDQCPHFHECMRNTHRVKQKCPNVSSQSIILSWMMHTSTGFHCTQQPQQLVNEYILCECNSEESDQEDCVPSCITPYIAQLTQLYDKIHCPPLHADEKKDNPPAVNKSPKKKNLLKSPPKKATQHTQHPTHSYSTCSRNTIISLFLQSISRSKKTIKYKQKDDEDRHMPGMPPKLKKLRPSDLHVKVPPIPATVLDH